MGNPRQCRGLTGIALALPAFAGTSSAGLLAIREIAILFPKNVMCYQKNQPHPAERVPSIHQSIGSSKPLRYCFVRYVFASASPMNRSRLASKVNRRPIRIAMLAMWQSAAE